MLFSQLLLAAAAVASPVALETLEKRLINQNDYVTLNTLLYLENLQFALYNIGCNRFSDADYASFGYPVGFRQNVCYAGQEGQTYIATLTAGLTSNSATYVRACNYTFPSVTTADDFVNTQIIVNQVVISAYLGASQYLADVPGTDEVAQSIMAVKARQGSFLRSFSGAIPFPEVFDTGISQDYANHLVQQFISRCPSGSTLAVNTYPNLGIVGLSGSQLATVDTNAIGGTTLSLTYPTNVLAPFTGLLSVFSLNSPLYVAFISQNIFTPTYVQVNKTSTTSGTVVFPRGAQGIVYAVLTPYSGVGTRALSMDDLTNSGTAAGPVGLLVS